MKPPADPGALLRRAGLLVPWLVYLGITIVGPAANGAWRREDFAEHVLLTVATSSGLTLMWLGVAGMAVGCTRHSK